MSFPGDDAYNAVARSANVTLKAATRLTYTGPSTATYGTPLRVIANLVRSSNGAPVEGRSITFSLQGSNPCTGVTNATGTAACWIDPVTQPSIAPYGLVTSFTGDGAYLASEDREEVVVQRRPVALTYEGPATVTNHAPVTLRARMTERTTVGTAPVANKELRFLLGTGYRAQGCIARTDASGVASCIITSVFQPGPTQPINVSFAGDATRAAAQTSTTVQVVT